jgi:hypothetical protein
MKPRSDAKWQDVKSFVATAMPRGLMRACVDLDSVLLHHEPDDGWDLGRALPRGRDLTKLLKSRHYQVVVLTARPSDQHASILKLLQYLDFAVDAVTNIKPPADAYFDDKAYRIPKNWK